MTLKSSASAPIVFTTTSPPPTLTVAHVGRVSITITWPHIYGISKYRVTITPGVTVDIPGVVDPGLLVTHNFTGLTMDHPYEIQVIAVNQPPTGPEAKSPPANVSVRTLPEWGDPPAKGLDGWDGSKYTPGKTNFTYTKSGIFLTVDNWAQVPVKLGALNAPDGVSADHQEAMSWIEFNMDVAPELQVVAIFMKAGHRWPPA